MPLGFGPGEILFIMLPVVVIVIPAWRIVSRVGYPGGWSLLLLIPLVNLAAFVAFAYVRWPLEDRQGAVSPHT
jgi:hypothetical protein